MAQSAEAIRLQAERLDEMERRLMGARWTLAQAEALIRLINHGAAHLPPDGATRA